MENHSNIKSPETWRNKKSRYDSKWYSTIILPFIWFEWVFERLNILLKKWAFIEVVENLGKLSVVLAVIVFISEGDERAKERDERTKIKYYQAWQVINSASGKDGDGGRKRAIEDLVAQGAPLEELDVSYGYLRRLDIGCTEEDMVCTNPVLWGANFQESDLMFANLEGINFATASFIGADILETNLRNTNLEWTDLSYADMFKANLEGANLEYANLEGTNLCGANMTGANLSNVRNWKKIRCIRNAKLNDAIIFFKEPGMDHRFREWAVENGAIFDEKDEVKNPECDGDRNTYGSWSLDERKMADKSCNRW